MIGDDPRIQSINERRADVDRLEAAHRDRVAEVARIRQEKADWKAQAAKAQTLDQPMPDPPSDVEEPVVDEGAHFTFNAMRQELDAEERLVLVEIRDAEEQKAADAEQALLQEAVEPLERLADLAARLNVVRHEVVRCRQAVDVGDGSSRTTPGYGLADRTRGRIEVADIVEAVRSGESLLRVAPAPVASEERPHVDRGTPGLSRPFGTPPPWPKASHRPVEI